MDEQEKERQEAIAKAFERLKRAFSVSQIVCDPLDFYVRQRDLLMVLADYIILKDEVEDDRK